MDLGDGLMRHPVALYEIFFLVSLWLVLMGIERYLSLQSGDRFKVFMIAYLVFRFCVEFIKPGYTYFYGIGTIQIACMLGLLYYSRTIIRFIKNIRPSPQLIP